MRPAEDRDPQAAEPSSAEQDSDVSDGKNDGQTAETDVESELSDGPESLETTDDEGDTLNGVPTEGDELNAAVDAVASDDPLAEATPVDAHLAATTGHTRHLLARNVEATDHPELSPTDEPSPATSTETVDLPAVDADVPSKPLGSSTDITGGGDISPLSSGATGPSSSARHSSMSSPSSVVMTMMSALLIPGGSGAPAVPVESPLLWGLLAFARRQVTTARGSAESTGIQTTSSQLLSTAVGNGDPVPGPTTVGTPSSSNGAVRGRVTATDPDGGRLTFSGSTTTARGSVRVTASGTFTYTPTAAARHAAAVPGAGSSVTTDTFTVTVKDRSGGTATIPVTVTISPKNVGPTRLSASAGTPNASTGAVTVTATARDSDGDTLTFTAPASTAKGTVAYNGSGRFTYTPTVAARNAAAAAGAPASAKSDTLAITVSDGHGGRTTTTVTVAISPLAAPPNHNPTGGTYTSGQPNSSSGTVSGQVSATDPDNDALTYIGPTTSAKGGVVSVSANGAFTYTPTAAARHTAAAIAAPSADKTDSFTVTVADGKGGTLTVPISVPVSPANAAPVGSFSVGQPNPNTGAVTGAVTTTDADGDTRTYSGPATSAKGGAVQVNADGTFTYTPTTIARHAASADNALPSATTDTFVVTAADGHGALTPITVTVTIGSTNAAPTNATATVSSPNAVTGAVTGTVTATDADADTLKYTAPTATSKGSIALDAATGSFTYTPTAAARAAASLATATAADKADAFTVTIADGHGGSMNKTVNVSILGSNNAPGAAVATVGNPNPTTGVVTGTITATDPDGDSLTYTAPTSTPKGSVTINTATGSFTYTPTAAARYAAASPTATAADRADTFTVTISDGRGGTSTKSVSVTVAGQAAAPSSPSLTITSTNADTGVVTGTVTSTDPNGDPLTFGVVTQPTNGTLVFNASTGSFTYTPRLLARLNANQTPGADADNFTVTASDGTLTTTTSLAMPLIPAHFLVDNDSLVTGPNSNSVAFSPDGTRAYITRDSYNGDPGAVYVIDTATDTILGAPITVGYRPQALVVSPDGTRLYVSGIGLNANRYTAAITVINTATNSVIGGPIFVGPVSSSAFGIAITPDGGRLYVTDFDNGTIAAVNTATRTVGSPISLGRWAWGVVVSPDGKFAYATSTNATPGSPGKVSIINTATNTVVGTIPVGASARGIALNADGTRAYVSNYGDGTVTVINLTTNSIVGNPISVGMKPVGVAVSPDGSIVYVTRFADQTPLLVAINTVTNTVIGTPFIAADSDFDGYAAQQIASSKAANKTYSISLTDGTISIITAGSVANNGKPIAGTPNLTTDSAGVVTGSVPFTDPNGDTLRYTAAPGLKGTVTIDPISGVFVYTPSQAARQRAATYNASAADRQDVVVLFADDGNGGVTAVSVTVPVSPAGSGANNQAPIAGNPVFGTADADTGAVSGSASFTDPDNDTLHYEVTGFAQKGTVGIDPTTGAFTYTPYTDYRHIATIPTATTAEKTDTFTVTASDHWGHSTSATVTVTISPYNSTPTFQLAQVDTAASSGTVSGRVYFYDNDYRPTNDTLSYTATTSSRGTVTISSTGDFTYTPSAAARNKAASPTAQPADLVDSIVVTVNDGHGGTASTTVLVAILPAGITPNRALTNYGGYTVTSQNNTTGTTAGTPAFFDPDNDTLRYFTTGAGRGTVSVDPTTGAFTYTPSAQAQHDAAMATDDGRDTFTIIAVDGHGNVAAMPISLAIGTQNTKPVLGSTTFGSADPTTGAIIGKVTVTDPDNDTLTYVGPTTTGKGKVTVDRQTGAFTYTPAPAARSYAAAAGATADDKTDSFTITAYDNHGAYVSTVVTLTISPSAAPNRAPIQVSPTTIGTPDPTTGAVSGHLHLTDLDQDGLTFTFEPITGSRSEDGVFVVDDGRFTIDGQTGKWTFVPTDARRHEAAADDGRPDIYSFHWTATDTRGASISGDISVPVIPLNAAPAVDYATQTRDPSTGVITGRFTAQDTDGDYLKVSVSRQPAGGTVVAQWVGGSTYQWTYTPNELDAYYRPDFTLTVTDGHGGQSSVYETADKQAPTSTAAPITTGTNTNAPTDAATGAVSGKIFVPDSAGRTLTYTRTIDAAKGTVSVNPTTGAYTYTPTLAARYNAAAVDAPAGALTDSFVVTVTEGGQTVSVMTIVVPISPLNRRPATTIAADPPDANGLVRGRVTAVDPDGDVLTLTAATTSRLHGSVSLTGDGSFVYAPDLAYRTYAASHPGTTDFFVVTITEGNGRSTLIRVPVTIAPLNLPPAPPTPVAPPSYPPAPIPTSSPGPGLPVSTPNPGQPKGPTPDDIFKNPNRIGVINSAIEVNSTKLYEVNMHDGTLGVGATIYQYSAVTVKYSADKPAAPGDVYVLQIKDGHVAGFQLLKPGESTTGQDVFWSYSSLSGGGYGNPERVVVVTFAPGTFPYRYWPGSTPSNGGDPVRGPDDPAWTPYSDIEDEIANVLECYRKVSCLLPIGAKTAEIAADFGPGMQGSEKAKIVADLVTEAVTENRDELFGEDVEAATAQLLRQCIDGLGNSAT